MASGDVQFHLVPYIGATPITFEMTPPDVERILGAADRTRVNTLGERNDQYGLIGVRFSNTDGKVVEIGFAQGTAVEFEGENLFKKDNVVDFLMRFDPHPYEWVGFLVFLGLGMTATGFHDDDDSQKAFTVFRKGRWDQYKEKLAPFSLK